MISQKELSEMLGISQQHLSSVKKCKRRLGRRAAARGAARTGIPEQELLFLDGIALIARLRQAYEKRRGKTA